MATVAVASQKLANGSMDGSIHTFGPQYLSPDSIDSPSISSSHDGQHKALKKVSIVDCGSGQEIIPNGQPFHIENEYFTGKVMLMIRTPDVDDSKEPKPLGEVPNCISNYMKDKKRRFEFQFQIRFKKVPKGPLFLGTEVESNIKISRFTRGLVGLLLGMIRRINSGFHYSFGTKDLNEDQRKNRDYEKTHLSFPVEASMDRVVITKPGEEPPTLGEELHESPESVRRRRRMGFGSVEWNTEDTFSMCLWNAYADWIKWKTMNVPGCKPFPLSNVTGSQPIYLCVYELSNITPQEYRKQKPGHIQRNLSHYARIEFAHADVTKGGIAPRFNDSTKDLPNESCVETDSELCSEHSLTAFFATVFVAAEHEPCDANSKTFDTKCREPTPHTLLTQITIDTLQQGTIQRNNNNMTQQLDAGKASHSPSSEFMELVDVDHMSDFAQVVDYLKKNLDNIINEVHGFDKLLLDNAKTQLNCPPAPEAGDSHGSLLIRTLSEKEGPFGLTLKREFKVHDCGVDPENAALHKVEIREDVVKAPNASGQPPVMSENVLIALAEECGIAMAAVGIFSTLGATLAADGYDPVADNVDFAAC